MIRLPYNLGLTVRDSITKYRRKNNIPEPKELREIYNKQVKTNKVIKKGYC